MSGRMRIIKPNSIVRASTYVCIEHKPVRYSCLFDQKALQR
jgi:hypothetical protein